MELRNREAEIYIPDETPVQAALERTTHLGIGAHQDDLELMATHGILESYENNDEWFAGVVVTDGRGSPRSGPYASCTDEEMVRIRKEEQKEAARMGNYAGVVLMGYPSAEVKMPPAAKLVEEIQNILRITCPRFIYTHNPADKHDTHVAVVLRLIEALKGLPRDLHPQRLYGCEVWRGLDWLPDEDKVVLDVSNRPQLAEDLLKVHRSQVAGGKRYDLAIEGRKRANATFADSHNTDRYTHAIYAMELTPLLKDPELDVRDFTRGVISKFGQEVESNLDKLK